MLKAIIAAIIGVWNIAMLKEQAEPRCRVLRADLFEIGEIALIHGEDMIETKEIIRFGLTRP